MTLMVASVTAPVPSSLINAIIGRAVRWAGKWQNCGHFFEPLLRSLLSLGKESWLKFFSAAPLYNHYRDIFNYEPKFSIGAFLMDILPRIKNGVDVKNLNDNQSKGTHWVSLFINKNSSVYFDSFEVEYIPKEVLNKIKENNNHTQDI